MKYNFLITIAAFFAIFSSNKISAQSELHTELKSILAIENTEQRIRLADTFNNKLKDIISAEKEAKKIDIPERISQVFSQDKCVRIYTWCIRTERGMYKYYGILKTPKGTFLLEDVNINNENITAEKLTDNKWYGAVYFDIIEIDVNGKKSYTLLGNDLKGALSNKKIIDVLSFNDDENPVFGASVFEKKSEQRLIFEYNVRSTMYMHYNKLMKMIIYEILIPMSEEFADDHRFYVPDNSYDGLTFKNEVWTLSEDVTFEEEN
jgi:hypothetical protein